MKVANWDSDVDLDVCFSETGQTFKLQYAFVRKEDTGIYSILHKPFMCRDFITDVLYANQYSKKISVYNLTWDGEAIRLQDDKFRIILYLPSGSKSLDQYLEDVSNILPKLTPRGWEPFTVEKINTPRKNNADEVFWQGNSLLLEGDARFYNQYVLVANMTFFLRELVRSAHYNKEASLEDIIDALNKSSPFNRKAKKVSNNTFSLLVDKWEEIFGTEGGYDCKKVQHKYQIHNGGGLLALFSRVALLIDMEKQKLKALAEEDLEEFEITQDTIFDGAGFTWAKAIADIVMHEIKDSVTAESKGKAA